MSWVLISVAALMRAIYVDGTCGLSSASTVSEKAVSWLIVSILSGFLAVDVFMGRGVFCD